jgi:hypothetical protein
MKVRQDFVTNSSSSSFIIAFDARKQCFDYVSIKTLLFGDKDEIVFEDGAWDEEKKTYVPYVIKTDILAQIITEMMEVLPTLTYEEILFEISERSIDSVSPGLPTSEVSEDDDDYYKKCKAYSKKLAKCFADTYSDKKEEKAYGEFLVYKFEFSDHSGPIFSFLESEDIFGSLPHVKISNH